MTDLFEDSNQSTTNAYSAKDIEVLEGLEPVRRRPGMYIGGTDDAALHHLVAEILDNSMDEAVAGQSVTLTLEDGAVLSADLLVGADGIHSHTRSLVFGAEDPFIRPLGYHTAAYFFESAKVAAALGGDFKMMAIKERLVGLYEVEPNQIMAFFVLRADTQERPRDPAPILHEAFDDLGWVVPEVLAKMPEPGEIYYDVVAQIAMPRWHDKRVVLIGDAAHAVSLMAGQGASLAIAGGRALGQAMTGASDIDAALERFETQLRPLVLDKQQAGRRMADWFVPKSNRHVWLRDLTVNVMNWPPLAGLIGRYFAVSPKGFSLQ